MLAAQSSPVSGFTSACEDGGMAGGGTEDCFVCRKHRDRGPLVPGGPVAEDELVLVSHVVTPDALGREGATAYLGHLFVEPRRHAPGLADLTDAEARSVAWWWHAGEPGGHCADRFPGSVGRRPARFTVGGARANAAQR